MCYSCEGPWSPFDYCHILEVFAVPVVTQPVLSAFVMAAALGLLRVRRAGGLRSGEPLRRRRIVSYVSEGAAAMFSDKP